MAIESSFNLFLFLMPIRFFLLRWNAGGLLRRYPATKRLTIVFFFLLSTAIRGKSRRKIRLPSESVLRETVVCGEGSMFHSIFVLYLASPHNGIWRQKNMSLVVIDCHVLALWPNTTLIVMVTAQRGRYLFQHRVRRKSEKPLPQPQRVHALTSTLNNYS